jgi:hypothetical protein
VEALKNILNTKCAIAVNDPQWIEAKNLLHKIAQEEERNQS